MKGIILAGGTGTRLFPITKGTSKQLLAIYDKPMIYYPLSILMLAGIKDVLIITTPEDNNSFVRLLGNGINIGIRISYSIQETPRGIADAFIIGEKFIDNDSVCLILGDNIFYGQSFTKLLRDTIVKTVKTKKATIFGYYVDSPEQYGVVQFDENQKAISIEEKPKVPKSNYAVVGLYFYPKSVIKIAKKIIPSERNELEITSINKIFMNSGNLFVEKLGRGFAWLDTGTHESMLDASNFVYTIEKRQGLKIACLEEIAFDMGYISKVQLESIIENCKGNSYMKYLSKKLN